jgi:hypothetical protein
MDNIFDLLPFIIAIIVFIFRLLSGNKENKPQEEPNPQPASTTFDDLLKQITKQINEANQPKKEENQDKSLREQRLERQKAKAKKAAQEAKKIQEQLAMSYIEKGMTEEQRTKDHHFNPYKIQAATKNKFMTLLKDKENLKNAIILNEVLKPKHF